MNQAAPLIDEHEPLADEDEELDRVYAYYAVIAQAVISLNYHTLPSDIDPEPIASALSIGDVMPFNVMLDAARETNATDWLSRFTDKEGRNVL